MKINKLKIKGFKSFKNEVELVFPNTVSFILVTGSNLIEPKLGANGCGKSSLFESLSFVLFGKTSTNLKAGDIGNWELGQGTEVELEFEIDKTLYNLKRTWNPNSLTLNGSTVTQTALEDLIRFNFESFSYSVFISQFGQKFLDFTPSDKMSIVTEVIGETLNKWEKFSTVAKDKSVFKNEDILTLQKKHSGVKGMISILEKENYEDKVTEWETNRKLELSRLQTQFDDIVLKIDESYEQITIQKDLKQQKEIELETIQLQQEEQDTKVNESLSKEIVAETNYKTIQSFLKEKTAQLNSFKKLQIGNCPTCKQQITEEHKKEEEGRFERELAALEKEKNELEKVFIIEKEIWNHAKELLNKTNGIIRDYESKISSLDLDISKLISKNEEFSLRKERIEKQEEELSNKENPFTQLIQQNIEKLRLIKRQESYLTEEIKLAQQDYEIYKYWTKGFKDIKLMLVEHALKEFEIEINNNLSKLGLNDWLVSLSTDFETKGGNIKKGFTILVKSPTNAKLVPFECWSGGEGQRIRLAVTFGLIDFIKNRRGATCDLLILDEPTQFLSEEGISDLISVLYDKTKTDNLKTFLIDHRNLQTSGIFNKILEVYKNEEGSNIKWN
jgi:DNA repair protein SbcC/Rad50